jgi:hypothetical protein
MKKVKLGAVALALSLCTGSVFAKDVEFSDLYASSVEFGLASSESGSGTHIAIDWSLTENIAFEGEIFNYKDEEFTEFDILIEDELDSVSSKRAGLEISYGLRAQHIFYDLLDTPFSVYVSAGNVKINYDDIRLDDESDTTSSSTDDDDEDNGVYLELESVDSFYYGVGSTWFLNNRTSIDVGYVVYDEDERDSSSSSNGTIKANFKYAPVKNFGVSLDYTHEDVTGERRTGISVFVRW